jgi:hypothetical protein
MTTFGLLFACGSFLLGGLVYGAGVAARNPSKALVLSGLGASVVGIIAGVTLAIAGLFV